MLWVPRRALRALALIGLVLLASTGGGAAQTEDDEETICFNNCSGHGRCEGWTCRCDIGYTSDDCSHALLGAEAASDGALRPVLSAGHFNVTAKSLAKALAKHGPTLLVAFSSRACAK